MSFANDRVAIMGAECQRSAVRRDRVPGCNISIIIASYFCVLLTYASDLSTIKFIKFVFLFMTPHFFPSTAFSVFD